MWYAIALLVLPTALGADDACKDIVTKAGYPYLTEQTVYTPAELCDAIHDYNRGSLAVATGTFFYPYDLRGHQELVAFMAMVAAATEEFTATRELQCCPTFDDKGHCVNQGKQCDMCDSTPGYAHPCLCNKENVQYFGRGALMLTWNYNYGYAANLLASQPDPPKLCDDPDLVATDSKLKWMSGLLFWMNNLNGPRLVTCHEAMTGQDLLGFGGAIEVVKGVGWCSQGTATEVCKRVRYYVEFSKNLDIYLQVPLECGGLTC